MVTRKAVRWWWLALLFLSACVPTTGTEPAAQATLAAAGAVAKAATAGALLSVTPLPASPTPEAYPYAGAVWPTSTHPPGPYPPPTATPRPDLPEPTDPPEPTDSPEPTDPPMPTVPPTPVVTPVPTAVPPIILLPEGVTPEPFTLYYRDGDVIRSLSSTGTEEAAVFLDPVAEFGLYLTPEEAQIREWGSISPDGRMAALLLTKAPDMKALQESGTSIDLYVFNRDSRDLQLLAENAAEPVWSPNGQRIAYRSRLTGGLWVAEMDTGQAREVYSVPNEGEEAHYATGFSWAPDNRRLVMIDEVDFGPTAALVVDSFLENAPLILSDYQPRYVQWSPSGKYISFIAGTEGLARLPLFVLNLVESQQSRLPYEIYVVGCGPRWSPREDQLAFDGSAIFEQKLSQADIWLVDPSFMHFSRLTYDTIETEIDAEVNDVCPLWSPDGTQLVYWRNQDVIVHSLIDGRSRKVATLPWSYGLGLLVAP